MSESLFPNEDEVFDDRPVVGTRQRPLLISVHGNPAPQGSKRAFYNKATGRAQVVESSKAVKPWREAVKFAALEERNREGIPTLTGPVAVTITFYLARPKGHYGTGRNAELVKESAPRVPSVKPDLDKLARSTLDALKDAGVYTDDAVVFDLHVSKVYADPRLPGALIRVQSYSR